MKLAGEGAAFAGRGADDASALYPGVCVMPSGRFLLAFRSAPSRLATEGQRVLICVSDDGGRTWSAPRDFFPNPPEIEGKRGEFFLAYITPLSETAALASLCRVDASDPSRPYYNPETRGILDHRIFFSRSVDGGESWSEPWMLEGLPHPRPTALCSPTLLLPDGRLMCQFETHKNHGEQGPVFFEAGLAFSADGGRRWGDYAVIVRGASGGVFHWDQRINVVGDGLLGLFWSYDDGASKYVNIHAARSEAGAQAPLGMRWSAPYDTGVPGQPSQPVPLDDGSIAMAYVDRTAAPAIKVRRSFDGGRTWPGESEVLVYDSALARQDNAKGSLNDMWAEMHRFSVGFPVAAPLPGGMLVGFYAGKDTDHTAIRWAKLAL